MAKQKILIDAFGADFPDQIINGIADVLELDEKVELVVTGNAEYIEKTLEKRELCEEFAKSLEKTEKLSLVLYVVMGWAIVVVIKDIVAALQGPAFWLLLAGGLAYTGGLVFYKLKYKYMHSIWHLFVFAGSLLHYLCVVMYVLPMNY